MQSYILTLDQGTSSSRAILFDKSGHLLGIVQKEFKQIYPQLGWVEHDPNEIWQTQLSAAREVMSKYQISPEQINSIGITNQRETTIVWNKETGEPVYPAIVWQDKRTSDTCEKLKNEGWTERISSKTGLVIDAYFSATKIKWILDNVQGARDRAESGDLLFGTIDTWLIWRLTEGRVHATDYTNASRTMIYNISTLKWDEELLIALNIPKQLLPIVKNSSDDYGCASKNMFGREIPICGVAGDQQASLFGQKCWTAGMAKNTYGTGCFMLMNLGEQMLLSKNGLITTIAIGLDHKVQYALEGSVFIAGAAIQWLRDGLQIIQDTRETDKIASSIEDNGGVVMVPAFVGLGAPHWDMYARGAIFGLTRGTTKDHIIRATLEALAYQTKDVLDAFQLDSKIELQMLKVDGGACLNNFLMQFQADILQVEVERPVNIETTALGVAYLAGLFTGFYNRDELKEIKMVERHFKPDMAIQKRDQLYLKWQKGLKRSLEWLDDFE
ncbi:MAG: glycerol kinase GlpK [Chitinophagales bacterium]|nr:glycerol kinase GlpK [Chitinophagales bacterium]